MQPAGSVATLLPYLKANGIYRVLDYGAGTLRNSIYLANHGFFVVATDCRLPGRPIHFNEKLWWVTKDVIASRILRKMDLVLCNFVINIIEPVTKQKTLVRELISQLRSGGLLLLESKENRTRDSRQVEHALTREEMDTLVISHGLVPVMFLRGRISLAVLYKKE